MWDCATSHGMVYMCKIEGKMTQDLCLQYTFFNRVIKTNEWYGINHSRVIFNMIIILNILQN